MLFGSYLLQKVTTTTEDNLLDISQPPFFFRYEQDESSYELQIQSCLYGEQLDISLTICMCPEPISTILGVLNSFCYIRFAEQTIHIMYTIAKHGLVTN